MPSMQEIYLRVIADIALGQSQLGRNLSIVMPVTLLMTCLRSRSVIKHQRRARTFGQEFRFPGDFRRPLSSLPTIP